MNLLAKALSGHASPAPAGLAKFKCMSCGHEYQHRPLPTQCPKCSHLYAKWTNYKERP